MSRYSDLARDERFVGLFTEEASPVYQLLESLEREICGDRHVDSLEQVNFARGKRAGILAVLEKVRQAADAEEQAVINQMSREEVERRRRRLRVAGVPARHT